MLLVIFGIGLVLLAVGIGLFIKWPTYMKRTKDQDTVLYALNTTGGIMAGLALCIIIALSMVLSGRMIIDDKIAMYQEENTNIEDQISVMVKEYQDYETDTYTDLKSESPVAMVALYPELKSDTLVQKQIEIYTANNRKIKELKEEKLSYKPIAWWLYFGN